MKKNLLLEIEIPEGVEVSINDSLISVKGSEGENTRDFNTKKIRHQFFDTLSIYNIFLIASLTPTILPCK